MPGFGPFAEMDQGLATQVDALRQIVKFGDYLGAAIENTSVEGFSAEAGYPQPSYGFSVSGRCPNLPWNCITGTNFQECTSPKPPRIPPICETVGCASKEAGADGSLVDLADTALLSKACLHHQDQSETPIRGGLCFARTVPTGELGCVYTYKSVLQADSVWIDDLVGITALLCGLNGERKCANWIDWRENCHDNIGFFKLKFGCRIGADTVDCSAPGAAVRKETTLHCVEYDAHPWCRTSAANSLGCSSPRCSKLKEEERDLGLPFWRGRCNVGLGLRRAELAVAPLISKEKEPRNHELVDNQVFGSNPPCPSMAREKCVPLPGLKSNVVCTRRFAGVCSVCQIPGTAGAFDQDTPKPLCPWRVLGENGNKIALNLSKTHCVTTKATDLCCLYGLGEHVCDDQTDDVAALPLDIDGFLFAASLAATAEDNVPMVIFLSRWAASKSGKVVDEAAFGDIAYRQWGLQPPRHPESAWTTATADVLASPAVIWAQVPTVPPTPIPPSLEQRKRFRHSAILQVALALFVAFAGLACLVGRTWQQKPQPADAQRLVTEVQMAAVLSPKNSRLRLLKPALETELADTPVRKTNTSALSTETEVAEKGPKV